MAERFKFSLDNLLEIRKQKEEESKKLFTESQRKKSSIEQKLDDLKESYKNHSGINGEEDVVYQKLKRYYLQGLEKGIRTAKDELVVQNLEVDKRRKELVDKQIQRKTVETLKEKRYEAYIKEQERVEQNTLDELALYAYIRK